MNHYLVYWKIFLKEILTEDDFYYSIHQWVTDFKPFANKLQEGDILWIVIQTAGKEWRLVQRLVVSAKPILENKEYVIACNKAGSGRFNPAAHSDIQELLRKLSFKSNRPIKHVDGLIGRCIQRPRILSQSDIPIMESFAQTLNHLSERDRYLPI
jgi:hypothetical protein